MCQYVSLGDLCPRMCRWGRILNIWWPQWNRLFVSCQQTQGECQLSLRGGTKKQRSKRVCRVRMTDIVHLLLEDHWKWEELAEEFRCREEELAEERQC